MSDDKVDPNAPPASRGLIAINEELESLEGKDDPISRKRYLQLIDELINLGMAMGPIRRAIGRGKRWYLISRMLRCASGHDGEGEYRKNYSALMRSQ
jgi:hypothetical protein